jgi:hypothetical protein
MGVTKILIDNGSEAEILFLIAFKKMGYDQKQLRELTKLLYGFGGKRIEPVGVITLPVSFGTPKNPRTEYLTFDVIDMLYPYNAIFGRGLLNTFKAALHSGYLYLKFPATFRVISIFGSHQDARKIKKGFTHGHKNVHFCEKSQSNTTLPTATSKQKLRQSTRKPSKPMVSSKKFLQTQESLIEPCALAWRLANKSKRSY